MVISWQSPIALACACSARHPELRGIHDLRTRTSGTRDFVQFHVWVAPDMTVADAHRVMDEIEELYHRYGKRSYVWVDESWNIDARFNDLTVSESDGGVLLVDANGDAILIRGSAGGPLSLTVSFLDGPMSIVDMLAGALQQIGAVGRFYVVGLAPVDTARELAAVIHAYAVGHRHQ